MLQARPEAEYEIMQTISRRKSEALIFSAASKLGAKDITPEQMALMAKNTSAEVADQMEGAAGPALPKRKSFKTTPGAGGAGGAGGGAAD